MGSVPEAESTAAASVDPHVDLVLDDAASAAPAARRCTEETLRRWGLDALADDAALVATELATNAVLHAGPPATLRLCRLDGTVRIEVRDRSPRPPVVVDPTDEAMTGRGLRLIDALAERWGVEPVEGGKVVWCELAGTPVTDESYAGPARHGSATITPPVAGPGAVLVRVPAVPTGLLVAAKAHVDNIVRELTLLASGASTGEGSALSEPIVRLLPDVVTGFADARHAIKEQAVAAARRGEATLTLELALEPETADDAERYLHALEALDAYARDARLLTLETPADQQSFRRWYITTITTQLRAAAAGEPAPPVQPLDEFLLGELARLDAARRTAARGARLQHVTAAVARAVSSEDVAHVVVSEGCAALGAGSGALVLPDASGQLHVVGELGYHPGRAERFTAAVRETDVPASRAVATGSSVWLEDLAARDREFPGLATLEPGWPARCAVPLRGRTGLLGALQLCFDRPHLFDADERAFVEALGAIAAQTLERTRLHESQQALADRLSRLQAVTSALGHTADVDTMADTVVEQARVALGAAIGTVCLLTDDGSELEIVAARGVDESMLDRYGRFPLDAPLPAAEAARTGRPVVARSLAERDERYPEFRGIPPFREHALACLPLAVDSHCIGVLTLTFDGPRAIDDDELRFLLALADACAQALERARALASAAAAGARLAFLAEASAELAASMDYERTLRRVAHLAVPKLGDWCSVTVVEDGAPHIVAVEHVDPAQVALARELQQRFPDPPDREGGVPEVLRTGRPVFVPVVTDAMLAAGAQDEDHLALIRRLGLASVIIVPLTARGAVLGALTLIRSDPARPFRRTDLALAEDLARRAGTAVDNARLYRASRPPTTAAAAPATAPEEVSAASAAARSRRRPHQEHELAEPLAVLAGRWSSLGVWLSLALLVALFILEVKINPTTILIGFFTVPPLVAATTAGPRRTATIGLLAVALALIAGATDGIFGTRDHLVRVAVVATVSALATLIASAREARARQLQRVTAVAQVAQQAILRPPPPSFGTVSLAARYVSASREASIGGDLYEAVETPFGIRLLVGDVRGKGLQAVQLASVVLGAFRALAPTEPDPSLLMRAIDRLVEERSADEDFVTAVLAEIRPDGALVLVNCGHHPPMLCRRTRATSPGEPRFTFEPQVPQRPNLPLGLVADAPAATPQFTLWGPGDRLLLYTDGLVESRSDAGVFFEPALWQDTLVDDDLGLVLDRLVEAARRHSGGRFDDDAALLLAELTGTRGRIGAPRHPVPGNV